MDYNEATKGFSYLILDTCWWLELAQPQHYHVLKQLKTKVENGEIVLLIPNVILKEWKKHKDSHIKSLRSNINLSASHAAGLLEYLKETNNILFKKDLKQIKNDCIEIADSRYLEVCNLIENCSTSINVSDPVKQKASDFALAKKAPFTKKNSMADALIVFSTIEFLSDEKYYGKNNAIFASKNWTDFSQSEQEKEKLHEHLQDEFDSVDLKYEYHITNIISKSETLKLQTDERLEQEWWEYMLGEFEWQSEVERGR